jgi:hypothetical protein
MSRYIADVEVVILTVNKSHLYVEYGEEGVSGYGPVVVALKEEAENWKGGVWKLNELRDSMGADRARLSEKLLAKMHEGHKFHLPHINCIAPFEWSRYVGFFSRLMELIDAENLWEKLPSSGADGGSMRHRLTMPLRKMVGGYYALGRVWGAQWSLTEYGSSGPDYPDSGGMKMVLCEKFFSNIAWNAVADLVPQEDVDLRKKISEGLSIDWYV